MFENKDIETIHQSILPNIVYTPCLLSHALSKICNAQIFLKLENMQRTGSFKERGALNYLQKFQKKENKLVVAASAGNHAQAVAFHAKNLGYDATIFMPIKTPNNKVLRTQKFGADIRLIGTNYDEAYQAAQEFAENNNAHYLHAYNDLHVVSGQATIALEILQQMNEPDAIFVPVGGGGLLSGIATYFKNASLLNKTKFFGVEPIELDSMAQALHKGGPALVSGATSIAEGIAVKKIGNLNYELCKSIKPEMIQVSDGDIENALMLLLEEQKIVSEGAGAAALAGLLKVGKKLVGKKIVVIVSGGNIDLSLLSRLTGQALIKSGRLCRISTVISDSPGSLAGLLHSITEANGNVIDIAHERSFAVLRWNQVLVGVTVETKDEEHENSLRLILSAKGYDIRTHKMEC